MHRWYGILLGSWLGSWLAGVAACGTSPPGTPQNVPDHFDDNLDVIMRSRAHPCGADVDLDGDGKVDVHYTYSYDAQGRSQRDLGLDLTGAIYEQIDYTWDNAGHLTHQHDVFPMSITSDQVNVFDTLGRQTQYRASLSDSDPGDNTSTLNTTTTIDYTGFDELGHSAHGDEVYEDHDLHTSQTLDRDYGYDDLGRRIRLDVHFAAGDLFQGWQHAYDDDAHTVATHLDEPRGLRGSGGFTATYLDTYDADGHWLRTHSVMTDTGSSDPITDDAITTWDGDRELSTTDTFSGPGFMSKSSTTFKYSCPSTRTAADAPGSALPPPAHRRTQRRRGGH